VIADEAHSSQSGSTARQLKEVLMTEETDDDVEMSSEDILDATVAARKGSNNLNYYAFTATPKAKPWSCLAVVLIRRNQLRKPISRKRSTFTPCVRPSKKALFLMC
jgi:hypothetical protein